MHLLKALLALSEAEQYEFEHNLKRLLQGDSFFHEIPLISQVNREAKLLKHIAPLSANDVFLNCAIFYLQHLRLNVQQTFGSCVLNQHLFCLSYPDIADSPEERAFQFNIPNLCLVHQTAKSTLLHLPQLTADSTNQWLFDSLEHLNLQHTLTIHYSQFHSCNELHIRYYLIFNF